MKSRKYLLGAATIGLTAAMASTPALANDDTEASEEVSLEAQGSFAGFRQQNFALELEANSVDLEALRASTGNEYTGSLIDPNPELIVRDDIGTSGAVDVNNVLPSVVQLFRQNNVTGGVFFNCTGTVINPRTILTAAHCLNSVSSESYGTPESGAENAILIASGISSAPRIFNYLDFGVGYSQGGVATSTDVIIHPAGAEADGGLPFPWADVAFIATDEPITDVGGYLPLLLTPLDELTHMILTGYGTPGTGNVGPDGSNPFLRRIGENMLGAIASQATLIDNIFPAFAPSELTLAQNTQSLYFVDFDNPDRLGQGQDLCIFSGTSISCPDIDAVLAIDWFGGDALDQEAGTAPGDSGSPIIADEIAEFPLITGVLSGGYDFFGTGNRYADISFYNPLFPFFQFITENTPYKYVSAKAGDGKWSDPTHWTQDLDPGFIIQDENGDFVNGIPEGEEPGVYVTSPSLGEILGNDISDVSQDPAARLFDEDGNPIFAELPESSVLLGPGSTGFVPQNTDGTPGEAFKNPAQYFDVLLLQPGTTSVDIDVTIDRLTIGGAESGFNLKRNKDFTAIIGVEQSNGFAEINGTLNAGNVLLFGGLMSGSGTINTTVLANVAGAISVGDFNNTRTLTINGDYIQTQAGVLFVDLKPQGRGNSSDLLKINGDASLGGFLAVSSLGNAKFNFGNEYTVVEANSIDGQFDEVVSLIESPVLFFDQIADGTSIVLKVNAREINGLVGQGSELSSLAETLDTLRFSGRYSDYLGLFNVVDTAGFDVFGQTLLGLTPTSGFQQTFTANSFAQRFTGQVAQRTLALRGAGNAAAGFSAAGNASFAQASVAPGEEGRMGFFGSVSGSYLTMADSDHNTGATALQEAAFTQAGELTLGADYRMSDTLTIGVAMSNVRDGAPAAGAFGAAENESQSGAIYASKQFGDGFADGYVGYSDQRLSAQRASVGNAGGISEGKQTFAGVRLGYAMQATRDLMVGPVASIDYVRSDIGGYRESGAGALSLDIHDRTFMSLGAKLGAMAALDMNVGLKNKVTAFGSVAYARELGKSEDVVTASFVGASDLPFSIARQLDTEWVAVNAGAELSLSDSLSTSLSVTSDLGRGDLTNNQANVSLNWRF